MKKVSNSIKIAILTLLCCASGALAVVSLPGAASADPVPNCGTGIEKSLCSTTTTDQAANPSTIKCDKTSCDLIGKYVNPLITLLSAMVGVSVVISIIIGGIQYGSSAGDPKKVTAAKNRIRNAVIALFAFMFLYAFLQFIVPGGIFKPQ